MTYPELYESGVLQRRIEQGIVALGECRLCPRRCGANRREGEVGFVVWVGTAWWRASIRISVRSSRSSARMVPGRSSLPGATLAAGFARITISAMTQERASRPILRSLPG